MGTLEAAGAASAAMPDNDHDGQTNDGQPSKKTTLTPIRAHYLKKALIQLEFARELQLITAGGGRGPSNISTLSYLGAPFSPLPKDAPPADIPFLKYVLRQFVLTFPFVAAAPKDFYSQKLQPFVAVLIARGLTPTSALDDEVEEDALQRKILQRMERNLSLFLGSAVRLVEAEEVVRLTQADLNRLEAVTAKRERRRARSKDSFDVNVVTVRTVVEKGRLRNRAHDVSFLLLLFWVCHFLDSLSLKLLVFFRNLLFVLDARAILMSMCRGVTEIFGLFIRRHD